MKTKNLFCEKHGERSPVLACVHIQQQPTQIFVVPADDEYETQAWCATCEAARMADEGWYDAADATAQWRYICSGCYQKAAENCTELVQLDSEITPDEKPKTNS